MSKKNERNGKTRLRVTVDWIVGCTLLAIGVLGFILPILQGWIFVLAGLAVLSSHSRRIERLNRWLRSSLAKLRDQLFRRGRPAVPIPDPVPVVPSSPRLQPVAPEEADWTASPRC